MRLKNIGAGEITDRLTILALKILFGTDAGRDVKHFVDERNSLLTDLRGRTLNGKWFEAVLELAAVNAMLWHAEDALRGLRTEAAIWEKPDSTGLTGAEDLKRLAGRVMPVAFRIQALNDARAGLIERINKDSGDHVGGAEKVNA